MSGEYNQLWQNRNGQSYWADNAPQEHLDWLSGLADAILDAGSEPVWSSVGEAFRERFGVDKPVDSTLKNHVRYLVKTRG